MTDIALGNEQQPIVLQGRLLWLFVVAAVLALVTAPFISDPEIPAAFHLSSVVFLCVASGFWLGLGTHSLGKRLLFALGVTIACGSLFTWGISRSSNNDTPYPLILCCSITSFVGIISFILRYVCSLRKTDDSEGYREALQFKVRDVMVLTVFVAILLTIGRQFQTDLQTSILVQVIALAAIFAFVSVVEIWALLGKHVSVIRIVVLAIGLVVAVCMATFVIGRLGFFWGSVVLGSQLLVIIGLVCIRQLGFRFVRTLNS